MTSSIQNWTIDGIESMNENELSQLLCQYEQDERSPVRSSQTDIAVSEFHYTVVEGRCIACSTMHDGCLLVYFHEYQTFCVVLDDTFVILLANFVLLFSSADKFKLIFGSILSFTMTLHVFRQVQIVNMVNFFLDIVILFLHVFFMIFIHLSI